MMMTIIFSTVSSLDTWRDGHYMVKRYLPDKVACQFREVQDALDHTQRAIFTYRSIEVAWGQMIPP